MTVADVLIVGAGPSGLTAAAELRRHGVGVVVAEREAQPGGVPRHTDHIGFGIRDRHRITTGPRYAAALVERAEHTGVEIRTSTTVLAFDGTRAELATPSGPDSVSASVVVLATGVRERPRAARLVAGDRPSGVLTTGALQQFAVRGQRVGQRAVIVGAEHVSFSAVLTLRHLGCEVVTMTTPLARHQTYAPLQMTATRRRVPIKTDVSIVEIIGQRRVESVVLSDGSRIACDTVVFTGDWVPDNELARRSGIDLVTASRAPVVDNRFRTGTPDMFAIGNLVHPTETADVCAIDGRAAASAILERLAGGAWPAPPAPILVDDPVSWAAFTGRGITVRVNDFVTGRIELVCDGETLWSSRRRTLVPNRSITVPGAGETTGPLRVRVV